MKKAYLLCRQSTDEKGNQTWSIPYQEGALKNYFSGQFDEEIWFKVKEGAVSPLIIKDGVLKSGRKEFFKIINLIKEDIENGDQPYLIGFDMSRIARNMPDFMMLYEMRKEGLTVQTSSTVFRPITEAWDDQLWLWQVEATMAIAESQTKKKQKKGANTKALEAGKWVFGIPIGYIAGTKVGNSCGDLGIDPIKGEGVKEIFSKYLEFEGGVKAFVKEWGGYFKEMYNLNTSKSQTNKMLRNRFYIGEFNVYGGVFNASFRAIFHTSKEKALFNAVQKKLDSKSRKKNTVHNFLFSRSIKCKCGQNLIGEVQKGNVYYRCHTKECDMKTMREDKIFQVLKEFFTTFVLSPLARKNIKQLIEDSINNIFESDKKKCERISKRIEEQKKELQELMIMRRKSLIDDDEFIYQKDILKQNMKVMQGEIIKNDFLEFLEIIQKNLELLENGFIEVKSMKNENLVWLVDFYTSNLFINKKNALSIGVYEFLNFKKLEKMKMADETGQSLNILEGIFEENKTAFHSFQKGFIGFYSKWKKDKKYKTERMGRVA